MVATVAAGEANGRISQLLSLAPLAEFEVEMLRIEERDDPPEVRAPKHWHLFHVVARKRL